MPSFAGRLRGSGGRVVRQRDSAKLRWKWQNGVVAGEHRHGGTTDPGFEPGEQPGDFPTPKTHGYSLTRTWTL